MIRNPLVFKESVLSKYGGLKRIDNLSLPHPDWLFIKQSSEIPSKPWADATHGWTIRCAPKRNYSFGLPARHRLRFSLLCEAVSSFSSQVADRSFVIYPSWEYNVSGSCQVSIENFIFEIVIGDIAPVLRGKKSPDAVCIFDGPYYSYPIFVKGEKDILSRPDLELLLKSCKKVVSERLIILE
jgi:hypothetical protein